MTQDQIDTIEKAANNIDKLNAWEVGFIDGLIDRKTDYELSEKQEAALNSIGDKVE